MYDVVALLNLFFFQLKIRHDNSAFGSAWFLDRVEVSSKNKVSVFPCQRWLSTKEDDGQIERTLVPVTMVRMSFLFIYVRVNFCVILLQSSSFFLQLCTNAFYFKFMLVKFCEALSASRHF